MAMHYIKGNLLDSKCNYICHQVNCKGIMNSGIAKQIREKWPRVYDNYRAKFEAVDAQYYHIFLGSIQFVPLYDNYYLDAERQHVVNIFAQNAFGRDSKRYTSYDAFWLCLGQLKQCCREGSSIAFPDHIGCGLGGANWQVIKTMIEEVLAEDFEVYIYQLD